MRIFKIVVFILVFLVFFSDIPPVFAQSKPGVLYGSVFLPAKSTKKRTFRGRSYRNRRAARTKSKSRSDKDKSRHLDVIISAHPVSFKVEVAPLPEPVRIFQQNAEFKPRVIVLTPGTTVQFINQDRIYHNVFSITPGSRFNIGRRPKGEVVSQTVNTVGEVKLFCDIHSHMNATILSLETPYFARATENGNFVVDGLPPGIYEIRVYHPDYTDWRETIEIKTGEKLKRNFRLSS